MKGRFRTLAVAVFLTAGVLLLTYPAFSDAWNRRHAASAYTAFDREVRETDRETLDLMWLEAEEYNRTLPDNPSRFQPDAKELQTYSRLLAPDDTGIMGRITVPKIRCGALIYHGTSEGVLQAGIGHMAGSSLPVGGPSVHTILVGHRGLPSAKLFTDLDRMEIGDEFTLEILGRKLCYRVDRILTVLPDEEEAAAIEEGMDYCTLLTCTPYGINTHRLLVRGRRTDPSGKGED